MKHKTRKTAKRCLTMVLALCMIFSSVKLPVAAAEENTSAYTGGLCEHHQEHTPECGYVEAKEEKPCRHEHTEECYQSSANGGSCSHEHTEECFEWVTNCVHEHTEECYAKESVSGNEVNPSESEQQELICSHVCSEESGCVTKKNVCQHVHDDQCGYSEGEKELVCPHIHDELCGYEPAEAGQPCRFVCEICSAQENQETAEIQEVSVLPEEILTQIVAIGTTPEQLRLPEQLEGIDVQGNMISVSVTWTSNPEFDGNVSGEYVFSPVLPEGYVLAEGVVLPSIEVIVQEDRMLLSGEGTYTVSTAEEFEKVMKEIRDGAGTDYTIVVQGDLTLDSAQLGADGKKIVIRSQENMQYLLSFPEEILYLSGAITFEKIHITPHTIYANGHPLVLGEGFGGGQDGNLRMTVYGGSDQDLAADTDLTILDGVYKLIAGGNSAGTLTGDTFVKFGGTAKFPTAADGKQADDYSTGSSAGYNLYQKSEMEVDWNPVMVSYTIHGVLPYGIYGGGINADTTGHTSVEMTGGTVYQIFGGGAANWNPNYAKPQHRNGVVNGDTSVTVTGGEVKSIYGGGYNGIDAYASEEYNDQVPQDARSTRAVVEGTASVTIGGDAHVPACEQSEDASTSGCDPAAVHGGSFHSTVTATRVRVGGNAKIETGGAKYTGYGYGSLFGAGTNDIVLETTNVILEDQGRIGRDDNELGTTAISQGMFGNITPLGYGAKSGCYIGGPRFEYGSEIRNQSGAAYAASVIVNGGQVDVISVGPKSRNTDQMKKSVMGNVLMQQTGGTIQAIEASCINNKKVTVNGNVDVKVSGGTVSSYIMGRYPGMRNDDKTITGTVKLELSGASADGFHKIPMIETMDQVTVKSGSRVLVEGNWREYDYVGKYRQDGKAGLVKNLPFFQVKELVVEPDGILALTQKGLVEGNIEMNGHLNLQRHNGLGGLGAKVTAPLTAEQTASGTGWLLPFEGRNYGTGSIPKKGEEYVYGKTAGSSMKLTLENAGTTGLYVNRKNKTDQQDVWYIDQKIPVETITVTYQWKGGDSPASIPKDVQLPAPDQIEKNSAYTARQVTSATHIFDGWYLDEKFTKKFTDGTRLSQDTTLYGNWRVDGGGEILWYRNIYLQESDGTYSDDPYKSGQGGWAAPDKPVSISPDKLNGEEVAGFILGQDLVYDQGYVKERLSADHAIEAGKHNPLRIYYKRPYTVTYEYTGTVPAGAPQVPAMYYAFAGEEVEVEAVPVMTDYVFTGWKVKTPTDQSIENGKLKPMQSNVVLTGSWGKPTTPIVPTAAAYKVEHYKQQNDGSYNLEETQFPLYGEIGKNVTAVAKSYDGYSVNQTKSTFTGVVIKPVVENGEIKCLTLKIYYDKDPAPNPPKPDVPNPPTNPGDSDTPQTPNVPDTPNVPEQQKVAGEITAPEQIEVPKQPDGVGQLDAAPKTGDSVNLILWISLLAVSGIGLTVLMVGGKKKRHCKKRRK